MNIEHILTGLGLITLIYYTLIIIYTVIIVRAINGLNNILLGK